MIQHLPKLEALQNKREKLEQDKKQAQNYFLFTFFATLVLSVALIISSHFSIFVIAALLLLFAYAFLFAPIQTRQMIRTSIALLILTFCMSVTSIIQISRTPHVSLPAQALNLSTDAGDKAFIYPSANPSNIRIDITDKNDNLVRKVIQQTETIKENTIAQQVLQINRSRILHQALLFFFIVASIAGFILCQKRHHIL